MKVVFTGGGSAGHVVPLRYIASQLSKQDSSIEIHYVGQRGDSYSSLLDDAKTNTHYIFAGKWRRYPRSWWKTLIDVPTWIKNLRDMALVGVGFIQSLILLKKLRPNAVFAKGGFVSLPVGMAAALLKIPIVTHDSDSIPGLTNRVLGRWSRYSLVASSADHSYDSTKVKVVGVPVNPALFTTISKAQKASTKNNLGLSQTKPLVLVIGGSLGSEKINTAMLSISKDLVSRGFQVVHISGKSKEKAVKTTIEQNGLSNEYRVIEFIKDPTKLRLYQIAADVVVARAGATSTAELAALAKPAVIIPGSQLVDQLNNSEHLAKLKAAIVLSDEIITQHPERLLDSISAALTDEKAKEQLSKSIAKLGNPKSAQQIAEIIIEVASG